MSRLDGGDHHTRAPAGYTILLVDDDQAVLTVIAKQLRRAGHEVLSCSGFAEAQVHLVNGIEPDLLITDIVLRESTGKRVASAVKQLSPRTRVAYMSGYPNIAVGAPVLQKPFSNQDLLNLVEEAMKLESEDPTKKKLH